MFIHQAFDFAFHLNVGQFDFFLRFELGINDPDTDNRSHPFPNIFTGEVFIVIVRDFIGDHIIIQSSGQGAFESRQVTSTLRGIDIIHKRVDSLVVGIVVLEGNFHFDPLRLSLKTDRMFMENCFILVQMFNEGCQSPLIVEFLCFIGAIIMENDFQSMIQECQFS